MEISLGLSSQKIVGKVYKLKKAQYDSKQSRRVQFDQFSKEMWMFGLQTK